MKIIRISDALKETNIPKVYIQSLQEFVGNIEASKNFNVISIRDSEKESSIKNRNLYQFIDNQKIPNIFVAVFDDNIKPIERGILIQEPQVKEILDWAKQKWEENHRYFIVHCTAGISRSSSIALLINYMFKHPDPQNTLDYNLHYPNSRVLEIGEKILNTPGIKEKTKKKVDEAFSEIDPDKIF